MERKVTIISYQKFRKSIHYKKYSSNVATNMSCLGFYPICQPIDCDKLRSIDIVIDIVKDWLKAAPQTGTVIWYRKDDEWGIPCLWIFGSNKEYYFPNKAKNQLYC